VRGLGESNMSGGGGGGGGGGRRGGGVVGREVSSPSADNYRYCARFKINVNSPSGQLIRARVTTSHIEIRYQHYHRF